MFVLHHFLQCLTNPPGAKTAAKEKKREKMEEGFGPSRATEPEAKSMTTVWAAKKPDAGRGLEGAEKP